MSSITAPETIEGTWEEISRQADRLNGHRLRVTILPDPEVTASRGKMITKGMFPALLDVTDEDFKAAEFHDAPNEELYRTA